MYYAELVEVVAMLHQSGRMSDAEFALANLRARLSIQAHVNSLDEEALYKLERMVMRRLIEDGADDFSLDGEQWLIACRETLMDLVENDLYFDEIDVSEDGVFTPIRHATESDSSLADSSI